MDPSESEIENQVINGRSTSSETLFTILDDKNKVIRELQSQVERQQQQLTYYLTKELTDSKVLAFSKTCFPEAEEISLPLNLAINRYFKQNGIPSKILRLHERMLGIEKRITACLENQEQVLDETIGKLSELFNLSEENDCMENDCLSPNYYSSSQIRLLNSLLLCTSSLRKKVEAFRICCNRLIIIEDERNSLIDELFSMPPEQRLNCNYLIGIQYEKAQLEEDMKRIIQDQRILKKRIRELSIVEKKLSALQHQLNPLDEDKDVYIKTILRQVNSDAMILLQMSKDHKECKKTKTETEISSLDLPRILNFIKISVQEIKGKSVEIDPAYSENDLQVLNAIREVLENNFQKIESFDRDVGDDPDIEQTNEDMGLLQIIDKFKKEAKEKIEAISEERDAYKCQVNDLQSIRTAYAQLVEKQPTTSALEREYKTEIKEKEFKIRELQIKLDSAKKKIDSLTQAIEMQKEEFESLKESMKRSSTADVKEKISLERARSGNPADQQISKYSSSSYEELKTIPDSNSLDSVKSSIFNSRNRQIYTCNSSINVKDKPAVKRQFIGNSGITCFEIISLRKDGEKKITKAIIKNNCQIKSCIEIVDSTSFCLKFRCSEGGLLDKIDINAVDLEDFDLINDGKKGNVGCFFDNFKVTRK